MLRRFGWPPDVTRRQTRRDLRMLIDAMEAGMWDGGPDDER